MQVTSLGRDGQVAGVELLTGEWPVTGTVVSLVDMPTPLPTPTGTLDAQEVSNGLITEVTAESSNARNVSVTVTEVTFAPSGEMRWHLLFVNDSDDSY
ncbi:MAG: hypothetical protein KDE53_26190, partial [Caldilineaceae bacterium]|nr:hypothetical protein [Caldilineaceae bacterium]